MSKESEFIEGLDEVLSPDQVAQLFALDEQGDTDDESENGGAPEAATDADDGAEAKSEAGKTGVAEEELDGLTSENAVILAKDGKHVIDFDVLVDSRARNKAEREGREAAERTAQSERERREAAEQELAALKADAQSRKDAGEAATAADKNLDAAQAALDAGIDPSVFGDFSEEGFAKGVAVIAEQLAERKTQALREELQEFKKALEPLQGRHVEDADKAHHDAILAAHPDVESIAESKELADWIASQPSFAQAGYKAVLANGSAQEVIEALDAYKASTGATQQAAGEPGKGDLAAKAKAVISGAKPPVPTSLSDIPGGRASASSRTEAMADMDGVALLGAMDDMSPEQIAHYLNQL